MAGISGYRSPVDLPIGQIPLTTDAELFPEMTDVYNAIHLINQYLDQLRIIAEGGGAGQDPVQTLPFNRFYVGTALEDIIVGSPVAPSARAGENGLIPGALCFDYTTTTPTSHFCGVALNTVSAGGVVQVGVGPGAIGLPGIISGTQVWAYSSLNTNGTHSLQSGFYPTDPGALANANGTCYAAVVGIAIQDDYGLVGLYTPR